MIESVLRGADQLEMLANDEVMGIADKSAVRSGALVIDDLSPQSPQWEYLSELRWMLYRILQPIGTMWKEAVILALASSNKDIDDCVNQYIDLVSLVEDLHLGKILLGNDNNNKPTPLLNGSEIKQRALQGEIDGRDFKRVVKASEEWQIRHVFHDLDSIDNQRRSQLEDELIEYLVTTFPEYAHCKVAQ